jgi:glycosyltransferase involved in cell wall biosynthesis
MGGNNPHVVHWAKFYPPEWGGMERVTYDLATMMARTGTATVVVAFTHDANAPKKMLQDEVTVIRERASLTFASQPVSLGWVWSTIRHSWRSQAVLVHAPNPLAVLPMVMMALLRLLQIGPRRIVMMWHSDIIDKGVLGLLIRPVEYLMGLCSTHIVATSPPYAEASPLLRRFRRKVSVVPLGIEAPQRTEKPVLPEAIARFVDGRPLLLAVGRQVPYKGFSGLLDAAALISSPFALVIVGSGPLSDAMEQQRISLNLQDKVLLTGRLGAHALDALFGNAYAYIMSSNARSEAFGVVLLEAMSQALPIVATDIPGSGVPWVVQDGVAGVIVPLDQPDALAQAVDGLLADPEAAKTIGKAGQQRFEHMFRRESMSEAITGLLIP